MTSVDLDAVEARVEALPWVADATVSRRWPGTVVVRVRERTAVAVAGVGSGAVVVDRHGIVLGPATAADRLPLAGPDAVAGPGERVPADKRRVVAMLAVLPSRLRAEVAQGTVGADGLGLVLRDGIVVNLGDPSRIETKADVITVLLAKADRATIATLDVAVADAPAITRQPPLAEPSAEDREPALTGADAGGA
jgi:cell division protein FtsQ